MTRRIRFLTIALALTALTPLAPAPWASTAEARQARGQSTQAFPHEKSDIVADEGVVYGVLPNGMRYALMRNAQPAGTASIRLRISAGAMQETPTTLGLAHFLEHMVFNGSKNVPEGEMVKLLQRYGLAFGPDTNAYTSFTETVYMLDLPTVDKATVDAGLMIMRETADRLTLDAAAIDRERGVILSEERARDTPEYRLTKARLGFLLRGQPIVQRWPIGTVERIQSVKRDDFLRFYQANYRPERAFLVITGDLDMAAVEAQIKTQFADWAQPGRASPPLNFGRVARRQAAASHFVEAGVPADVQINWIQPPDLSPDTRTARAKDIIESLGFAVINRRLQRMARQQNAPFIAAGIGASDFERSARFVTATASTRPGGWGVALKAIEQEARRAALFGVSQEELDREIAEYKAAYEAAAQRASTRQTRALAGGLVDALHDNNVFSNPKTDLEIFKATVQGLTAARVNDGLKSVFRGSGPMVFVSSPQEVQGGDAAILAAYNASAAEAVSPPVAETKAAFAYENFGTPGAVATRTKDAKFDLDLITFENGVKLTIKRTPFQQNALTVTARMAGGLSALPQDKPGLSILAPFAMSQAGLGKMSTEQIEQATAGRVVGLGFSVEDSAVEVVGATRPEDLQLQLQLLAAAVSDPGFRNDGLFRLQAAAENFIRQFGAAPDRVLGRDAGSILRSGDGRWRFPDLAQVRALSMDDFKAAYQPMLTQSPIEVSIVGDVDVDQAVKLVGETFGALPKRSAAQLANRPIAFPTSTGSVIELTHEGRPDAGGAMIAWPARDFSDARKARAVRMARLVLANRLVEVYREELSASYSPSTLEEFSEHFPGFGFVGAQVETPPKDFDLFFRTAERLAGDLRDGKFTDDDVARARTPVVDSAINSEKANPYWVGVLSDYQSNARRAALMTTRISDMKEITREEIIAAAREVFVPGRAVKIVAKPKAAN